METQHTKIHRIHQKVLRGKFIATNTYMATKPNKDTARKENYRPRPLMNIDAESPTKY